MARKTHVVKPASPARQAPAAALLEAVKWVALASKPKGEAYQRHALLHAGSAVATDGLVSAGHPMGLELDAGPSVARLAAALAQCDDGASLTVMDGQLSVRSGRFRALIECLPWDGFQPVWPDRLCGGANNALIEALMIAGTIDGDGRPVTQAVSLSANTVLSTDGKILFEIWHGVDMPPNLAVPKAFIQMLSKVDKKLIGFGFTERSFTLHFEGGAWLKTQLYAEAWPIDMVRRLLDRGATAQALGSYKLLPATFFEALKAIAPFADDDWICVKDGVINTYNVGASFEVADLQVPKEFMISAEYLRIAELHLQRFLIVGGESLYFIGSRVRGVIMLIAKPNTTNKEHN